MTRSKQILALLTSTAALTAFAPAASAASEDGRQRVAAVKPSAQVNSNGPARRQMPAKVSVRKFAPAKMSASKFAAARMRVQEWSEPVRR